MARQQSRASILKDMAELQRKLDAHGKAQGERIGRIAVKSGLASLDLTEAQLSEAFTEIAARFRDGGTSAGGAAAEPDPKPEAGAKKAHATAA